MSFPNPSATATAEEVAEFYAPQIKDKVILLTGIMHGGFGAYFMETVAAYQPKLLILADYNESAINQTAAIIAKAHPDVPTRNLFLDLGDLKKVWKAAEEVMAYEEDIDLLVNSAGVVGCDYEKTVDGLERQFATNYLGHWAFTNAILEKILKTKGRVVNVCSSGHRFSGVRFDDLGFSDGKNYDRWEAYGQSKTAVMLSTHALADRYGSKGLTAFSLHPGGAGTNSSRHLDMSNWQGIVDLDRKLDNYEKDDDILSGKGLKTLSQANATYLFAAFDQGIVEHNGAYLLDMRLATPKEIRNKGDDKADRERLWKLSNEIVGRQF